MSGAKTFHVYDFLNAATTDSARIKACMERDAIQKGGATVVFDRKDWLIDEAILLPANTTVILDGCAVIQKDFVYDNVFRGDNLIPDPADLPGVPLRVSQTENIRILGKNGAKIIGCDRNRRAFHPVLKTEQEMTGDFWGWRAFQICLSRCDGFEIGGLELLQTRSWAMSFDFCSGGHIHDIRIESNVKNGDGIDFRVGCHHCRVENITGFTSDDTVACTALSRERLSYPHKNYLYPLEPFFPLWDGTDPRALDIHDIHISGIYTGGFHHGVICLAARGLQVYNIRIEEIRETAPGHREAAVKLYTGYADGYLDGDLHHIEIRGVHASISDYAVLCNTVVKAVTVADVHQYDGAKTKLQFSDQTGVTIL